MAKTNATTMGERVMEVFSAVTEPLRTPENTPVPGGGSWHWDYTLAEWVANTDTSAPEPQSVASNSSPEPLPE